MSSSRATRHASGDFCTERSFGPLWVLQPHASAHELLRAAPHVVKRLKFLRRCHASPHLDHARLAAVGRMRMCSALMHV